MKKKLSDVDSCIQICLKEGIEALKRKDYDLAGKLFANALPLPDYSKLDPKKLVIVEPLEQPSISGKAEKTLSESDDEGYPQDWHHVTLHISPDGREIHSDEAQPNGDGSGKFGYIIRDILKNSWEFANIFER